MHTNNTVKVILFTYLFQINDWFGAPQKACGDQIDDGVMPSGQLSRCGSFRNSIQGFLHKQTDLYAQLTACVTEVLQASTAETLPIIELFKRMAPLHQLDIMCLVLLALPRALIAQMTVSGFSEEESRLWSTIAMVNTEEYELNIVVAIEL